MWINRKMESKVFIINDDLSAYMWYKGHIKW